MRFPTLMEASILLNYFKLSYSILLTSLWPLLPFSFSDTLLLSLVQMVLGICLIK